MKKINQIIAVAVLALAVQEVHAQVAPTVLGTWTNMPTWMTNAAASDGAATTSNTTSIISIPQNQPVVVGVYFAAAGATVSNLYVNMKVSQDGTNWSSNTPHQLVVAAAGTTGVFAYTNIPATALAGLRLLKISSIVNDSTNRNYYFTNWLYSYPAR
jgi:hypothetical protein